MGRPSKYSREVFVAYLNAIEAGKYHWQAAKMCGLNPLTIQRWMKSKPAFAKAVREAEKRSLERELANARTVGALGNWHLTRMLLAKKYADQEKEIMHMSERQVKELAAAWNAQRKAAPPAPVGDTGQQREQDVSASLPALGVLASPESILAAPRTSRPPKLPKPETQHEYAERVGRQMLAREEAARIAAQNAVWKPPQSLEWSDLDPHRDPRFAWKIQYTEMLFRQQLDRH